MVLVSSDKRQTEARLFGMSVKDVPKAEQGVCFCYSLTHPGNYEFLLTNGLIVVRSVVTIVFFDPFGWQARQVVQSVLGSAGVDRIIPVLPVARVFQDAVQGVLPVAPVGPVDDVHTLASSLPGSSTVINVPAPAQLSFHQWFR